MVSTDQWFTEYYSGAVVGFWLAAFPAPDESIAFLQRVFGPPSGQAILDAGCGGGRHAIPLALAGYRVVGLDASPEFLQKARESAGAASVEVEWVQENMRALPWNERFHGVICMGNAFGCSDRDGTEDFIASVARALKSGGRFVVETEAIAEVMLPSLPDRQHLELGDLTFDGQARYDAAEGRIDYHCSLTRNGSCETRIAHQWIYTAAEVRHMMIRQRLTVLSMDSSPRGDPFRVGASHLLLVAEKG